MRLVYDGSCRTCTELARWVRARDRTGRLELAAYQEPGVLERSGLSQAEAEREVWLIEESGERLGGPAAVNRLLAMQGGVWWAFAHLLRLPLVSRLEEATYHWFSRHRHWFDRAWTGRGSDPQRPPR